jgi:peroxiredoxin
MNALLAGLLLVAGLDVGPAVGEKIPAFQAVDQDGRVRTFADLRGPQGLVLLFFRSADW